MLNAHICAYLLGLHRNNSFLYSHRLTLAGSVGGHDGPVAALGARHSVFGIAALEAVLGARAAVAAVEHVQRDAHRTDHHLLLARLDTVAAVVRTLWMNTPQTFLFRQSFPDIVL